MAAATPQQQADYDAFVKNGMRLIYNEKGVKRLVASLDGDGDPLGGLASTVTTVALRLVGAADKAGKPLAPEVVLHGSGELLEQLADFSAQSGGHKYSDEELRTIAEQMVAGFKQQGQEQPPAPAGPELMPPRQGG